ncbi:MAG: type I-E CRISPR-associated protein Cse2/CasB [Microthrixaceae bacterium]
MTDSPERGGNHFMESTLGLRDGPGVAGRYAVYLSLPQRAIRELPLTDPHLTNCHPRVRDVCLMAGVYHRIPHRGRINLGTAIGQATSRHGGGVSEDTSRTRLLALMRQPWVAAAVTLRSTLSQIDAGGGAVDWHDLAWAAHHWDTPSDHTCDCARWARGFTGATSHDQSLEEQP